MEHILCQIRLGFALRFVVIIDRLVLLLDDPLAVFGRILERKFGLLRDSSCRIASIAASSLHGNFDLFGQMFENVTLVEVVGRDFGQLLHSFDRSEAGLNKTEKMEYQYCF